jgi:small subunit ribosomal protein S13
MGYLFETRFLNKNYLNYELTQVYGIGQKESLIICRSLGIQKKSYFKDLKKSQILKLKQYVENNLSTGSSLKNQKRTAIKKLIQIRSYRGSRHKNNLPCRGQRTCTNAKTPRRVNL